MGNGATCSYNRVTAKTQTTRKLTDSSLGPVRKLMSRCLGVRCKGGLRLWKGSDPPTVFAIAIGYDLWGRGKAVEPISAFAQ